jgi:hypothetical protein
MRKVVFTIDDIEYFKQKFKLSDKQVAEFFGEKESFKVIYTITGNGRNPDKYELTDYDGNKIPLDSLNGYQKGVVLNDCMAYFTGGEYHGDYDAPHGVIKIEEKEI